MPIFTEPYDATRRADWDDFIDHSCNGTFLLRRTYMDYHKDRFQDHSLIFTDQKSHIVGLLPACLIGRRLVSHGGLTYGGLIVGEKTTTQHSIDMLHSIIQHCHAHSIEAVEIKPTPYIYWKQPSSALSYALYLAGAQRTACSLSMTINLHSPLPLHTQRRRGASKAYRQGISIERESLRIEDYHRLLSEMLQSCHHVTPVHTAAEMQHLQHLHPRNIELITAMQGSQMQAGVWLFKDGRTLHTQYIAASQAGKQTGALDLLLSHLIQAAQSEGYHWLDFGTCTEQGGAILNQGLLHQKEGFGAKPTVYETYTLRTPPTKL